LLSTKLVLVEIGELRATPGSTLLRHSRIHIRFVESRLAKALLHAKAGLLTAPTAEGLKTLRYAGKASWALGLIEVLFHPETRRFLRTLRSPTPVKTARGNSLEILILNPLGHA